MKETKISWNEYYAIFLVEQSGKENISTLIGSAMTAEMGVEFAKFFGRKLEKKKNVVGLYVRKLFGDIIYAYPIRGKNDYNNKRSSRRNKSSAGKKKNS